MFLTRAIMEEILTSAADVCGKQITEITISAYWNLLSHVEANSARKAIDVFISQSKFPSVNEILQEAGYSPVKTRTERYRAEEALKDAKSKHENSDEDTRYKTESGNWTFEHTKVTNSETEAEIDFSACRNKLLRAGWNVHEEQIVKGKTEANGHAPSQTLFKCFFHCTKNLPAQEPSTKTFQKTEGPGLQPVGALLPEAEKFFERMRLKGLQEVF
jgi:hypothetical protein